MLPEPRIRAFTMIEVALSLAIVAFALVAIMGVLPTGLNVQQKNREDTIILQDSAYFLEALRAGQNSAALRILADNLMTLRVVNGASGSVYTNDFTNGMLNATQIVSQLSRPATELNGNTNWVLGHFRAFSGNLGERALTNNLTIFSYIVHPEIRPYSNSRTPQAPGYAYTLSNNLYEVKLTFQWPVLESGFIGQNRQIVRTLVSGRLDYDTSISFGPIPGGYFFQPSRMFAP